MEQLSTIAPLIIVFAVMFIVIHIFYRIFHQSSDDVRSVDIDDLVDSMGNPVIPKDGLLHRGVFKFTGEPALGYKDDPIDVIDIGGRFQVRDGYHRSVSYARKGRKRIKARFSKRI